jgi:hypothetical protein
MNREKYRRRQDQDETGKFKNETDSRSFRSSAHLSASFPLFTASAVISTTDEKKKEFCRYGTTV